MQAAMMTFTVIIALAFREWHAALAFLLAGGATAAAGLGAN